MYLCISISISSSAAEAASGFALLENAQYSHLMRICVFVFVYLCICICIFVFVCFSGLGNILLFLTKQFQVGQVSFLRIILDNTSKKEIEKNPDESPTFIISTEVFFEDDFLDTLLEFVQRTREGSMCRSIGSRGHLRRGMLESKNQPQNGGPNSKPPPP